MPAVPNDLPVLGSDDEADKEAQLLLSGVTEQRSTLRWRAVAGLAATLGIAAGAALAWPGGRALPRASVADAAEMVELQSCLCVFDVDRTLTGKQGWRGKCPQNYEVAGSKDTAYGQGTLLLSEFAQNMDKTFCGQCYHGIVTAGQASGPGSDERAEILRRLGGTKHTRSDWWQDVAFNPDAEVRSSLVLQAKDGMKQEAVKSMLRWWKSDQHIDFKPEDVHFFDDVRANVQPFEGTGFNARQISCGVRGVIEWGGMFEGQVGGCGATASEVVADKGVKLC